MVSVLAIGPKLRGFITLPRRWTFKDDTNPQHAFLRRGIKAFGPCCKILQHVNIISKYEQIYFEDQIRHFLRQVPPDLLLVG
jgi:hypothetical protein